jgi:hypothetical protein
LAVLGRLLVSSAERLDLPDFLSIDSYTQGDFKYLMKSFVGSDKPYILKGFDVINPENAIGTQNVSIRVAESVAYYPSSAAGPFFYGLEEGNIQAAPLVPELRKNSTNYVYLVLSTKEAAKDTRAFWDPDKNNGDGGEFTQDVSTQTLLSAEIGVSASSFPSNTIPVCKIVVGTNFIESIEDARDMMFRLGSGGLAPDPLNKYSFRQNPSLAYARKEPSIKMSSALDPNPFFGGDKNIQTFKEWMDAIMTRLAELSGTAYWYEDTGTFNLINTFKDALSTSIKSKGSWSSSKSVAGNIIWSEDVIIQSTSDQRDIIIRAGNRILENEQVMFVERVRGENINNSQFSVNWTNGLAYVNGSLSSFENLSKGDWIKKSDDVDSNYLRVEEFYLGPNMTGGVGSASTAQSIKLNEVYSGVTESKQSVYTKGSYLASDLLVVDRDSSAIADAAGNFYWMALRSDTVMSISDISTTTLISNVTDHDGTRAKVTKVSHGLIDGQEVSIFGSINFNGTYIVEVETDDVFYIYLTGGPFNDEMGISVVYATATTQAKYTVNGFQLESENHGFQTGETITISGTSNYNNDYTIFAKSLTQFTFAVPGSIASESVGLATCVNIFVRAENGPFKLERGETKDIGSPDTQNLMDFIGMDSISQPHPNYNTPLNYNTIRGFVNYNSEDSDNLTSRASKLTAMMADKAQDKTIKYAENFNSINNLTSGASQNITFIAAGTPTLDVILPSSANFKNTITLTGTLSLQINEVAYFTIDRNNGFSVSGLGQLTKTKINKLPVGENIFVFAYRLTGVEVYLYSNKKLKLGGNPLNSGAGVIKVRLHDPVSTTLITGSPVLIDGVTVVDRDKVLFTGLSSNPNRIYSAVVSGGNVTSWNPEYEFSGFQEPSDGDLVIVTEGTLFGDQLAKFTGSAFVFNDKVRYFNGSDYFEQSSLYTSTIVNNQIAAADVTTFNYSGSEYSIMEYSISRGTSRETGMLILSTDGTDVAVAQHGANISSTGVTLSADISGSLLRIRYVSDNTGSTGTIKFHIRRWSNSAGGPSGVPSYTGGVSPTGNVTASGAPANGQVAVFTGSSDITGNSNFTYDTATNSIVLNGLRISGIQVLTLVDDVASETPILAYDYASNPYSVIEYSLERNGERRVGRIMLTHNGTFATISDDNTPTSDLGVVFTADISGSNIRLKYTSSSTGFGATMKFSMRRWS